MRVDAPWPEPTPPCGTEGMCPDRYTGKGGSRGGLWLAVRAVVGRVGLPPALAQVNLVEAVLSSSRIGGMDHPEHGLKIAVELPAEAAEIDGRSARELASDLRLLWIIDRVRSGRISLGKGAALAGMDRWSFMRVMDARGVPVINYSVEDLKKDVATLESL